jgi:hypothetical protein
VCVIALPCFFSRTGNTVPSVQMTMLGYCMAGSGNSVAYFSDHYSTRSTRQRSRTGATTCTAEPVAGRE